MTGSWMDGDTASDMTPAQDELVQTEAPVLTVRQRGRRPTADPTAGRPGEGPLPMLPSQTSKRYDLSDPERRTVGHFRRLLAQRHIPDRATVAIDAQSLALEWSD